MSTSTQALKPVVPIKQSGSCIDKYLSKIASAIGENAATDARDAAAAVMRIVLEPTLTCLAAVMWAAKARLR